MSLTYCFSLLSDTHIPTAVTGGLGAPAAADRSAGPPCTRQAGLVVFQTCSCVVGITGAQIEKRHVVHRKNMAELTTFDTSETCVVTSGGMQASGRVQPPWQNRSWRPGTAKQQGQSCTAKHQCIALASSFNFN